MALILFLWGFARKKKSLNTFEVQLLGSSPTVACLINLLAGPKVVTRKSQHSSGNCIQPMNWLKTDILSHEKGGVSWWSRWRGGENVRSKRRETLFLFLFCYYVNGEFESTSLRFPFFCSPQSQNINILLFYETLSMKIFQKTKVTP